MKKYLLKITREFQADRPSEAFLALDNLVDVGAGNMQPAYLTQDPTKDTYVIIEDPNNDINRRINEVEAIEHRSPIKRNYEKDGIEIFAYPNQGQLRMPREIEVDVIDDITGDVTGTQTIIHPIHVRVMGGDTTSFNSLEEALAFADTLSPEKGYELIDIIEGKPSVIFGGRPSLEKNEEGDYFSPVVRTVTNAWGR
jgi:hypothetical protein